MSCCNYSCYNSCFDGSLPWWQSCYCQPYCCPCPPPPPSRCATWPQVLPPRYPSGCCCPSYAYYYLTAAQTLAAAGQINFTTGSSSPDISLSGGALLFARPGIYKIIYTLVATSGTPTVQLTLNGTAVPGSAVTLVGTGAYTGQAVVTVYPGQTLALTSSAAVTISSASITATRIA